MENRFYDLTFSPAVKRVQEQYGSRRHFSKFDGGTTTDAVLSDAETDFIESSDGFYMATVGEEGQPYIQFRGGEAGFLRVLDEGTLGFADFRGNLQYISTGNLSVNNKAALFLMDYTNRRRLKILVEAEIKDAKDDPELIEKLRVDGYNAKIERAFIMHVKAFDWNCPQHITPRYTIDEIKAIVRPLKESIGQLEAELAELRSTKK